jgi:hypothetical protein
MSVGACVVDTNVPIVANGDNQEICFECRFSTVEFLERLMNSGRLIVDMGGSVEAEYWRHLKTGYPGVGNRFIQHFFQAHAHRVDRIEITADGNNFAEMKFTGPLKNFDVSDRKFATLSKVTGRPVYVSVDTDWAISKSDLENSGVEIEFLCGENQKSWFIKVENE